MVKPSRREVLRAGGAMLVAGAVGRGRGTGALAQPAPAAGQAGWSFRSATDLAAALKKREVSAVELLQQVIARIEALDGRLNAVVVRDFERARAAAKAADVIDPHGPTLPRPRGALLASCDAMGSGRSFEWRHTPSLTSPAISYRFTVQGHGGRCAPSRGRMHRRSEY